MLSKKDRQELDALSKEIFGSSSRWQKLIDKGYKELLTEEIDETAPPTKEGEEPVVKKTRVPVRTAQSTLQYTMKYETEDTIKAFLLEQKEQLRVMQEQIAKNQAKLEELRAAQKAAEEAEKLSKEVQSAISGSAKV